MFLAATALTRLRPHACWPQIGTWPDPGFRCSRSARPRRDWRIPPRARFPGCARLPSENRSIARGKTPAAAAVRPNLLVGCPAPTCPIGRVAMRPSRGTRALWAPSRNFRFSRSSPTRPSGRAVAPRVCSNEVPGAVVPSTYAAFGPAVLCYHASGNLLRRRIASCSRSESS